MFKFLQKKLFTALRIPKAFLNFEEVAGDGKNLALQDIRFSRTINRVQQAIIQELNKVAIIHLYILGLEDELENFTILEVKNKIVGFYSGYSSLEIRNRQLKTSLIMRSLLKKEKKIFFIGGTLSYIVYGTIIWAFTQASVPTVAALRETSIIFALLIGTFFLKEKFTLIKTATVLTIFFGVILLKFF